jgi:hypothetical protein
MTQNKSSNIFIELSKAIKQKNYVFNYPLNCIFERTRYDPNSRAYHIVDRLNVNLQEGRNAFEKSEKSIFDGNASPYSEHLVIVNTFFQSRQCSL